MLVLSSPQWASKHRENLVGHSLLLIQIRCMRLQGGGNLSFHRWSCRRLKAGLLERSSSICGCVVASQKTQHSVKLVENTLVWAWRPRPVSRVVGWEFPVLTHCLCSLPLCPRPPTDTPLNNARRSTAFFLLFFLSSFFCLIFNDTASFLCVHKVIFSQEKTYSLQRCYDTLPETNQRCSQTFPQFSAKSRGKHLWVTSPWSSGLITPRYVMPHWPGLSFTTTEWYMVGYGYLIFGKCLK